MRRFELEDVSLEDGVVTGADGVLFTNDNVAISWKAPWGTMEFTPAGYPAIGLKYPQYEVVWIDKDMSILSPPEVEEEHGKHAAMGLEDEKTSQQVEHFFAP